MRADPARNVKIATEYRGLKGQYGAVTEMARRYRLSREQIRRIARAHPAGEVEQVEESTSRKAEPAAALIHVPVSRLEALDLTSLLELLRRIRHALGEAAETPPEGDLFRQNDWAAALAVECLRLERELYNRQNQLISIISNRHLSR